MYNCLIDAAVVDGVVARVRLGQANQSVKHRLCVDMRRHVHGRPVEIQPTLVFVHGAFLALWTADTHWSSTTAATSGSRRHWSCCCLLDDNNLLAVAFVL